MISMKEKKTSQLNSNSDYAEHALSRNFKRTPMCQSSA